MEGSRQTAGQSRQRCDACEAMQSQARVTGDPRRVPY